LLQAVGNPITWKQLQQQEPQPEQPLQKREQQEREPVPERQREPERGQELLLFCHKQPEQQQRSQRSERAICSFELT